MAILFIDDDISRHVAFATRNPGARQTASIVLAQKELCVVPPYIDEIWLDHDLGDALVNGGFFDTTTDEAVGTQSDTVRPLVEWMCRTQTVSRDTRIRIHSWNLPAAKLLAEELRYAGFTDVVRCPFSTASDDPK